MTPERFVGLRATFHNKARAPPRVHTYTCLLNIFARPKRRQYFCLENDNAHERNVKARRRSKTRILYALLLSRYYKFSREEEYE